MITTRGPDRAAARAAAGQLAAAAAASPAPAAPPRTCRRDSPSPVRAPPGCSPRAGPVACSARTLVASPMSHPVRRAYRAAACARRSARIAGDDPGPMTTPHLEPPRHRPDRSRPGRWPTPRRHLLVSMPARTRTLSCEAARGGRGRPSFTVVLVAVLPGAGEGVASSQAGGGHDVVGIGGVQAGDVVVGAGEAGDRTGPAAGLLRRTGELDRTELRLRHDAC